MELDDLELWGGVECTVNRVGDSFFDQLERSGHTERLTDIDYFAALGLKALRTPILWERTAPHKPDACDFSWSDRALNRMSEHGVTPIVGLVHHGSGPTYTNLLDPNFPHYLASYARQVAERYPQARFFTPINEPLTTARFSALYGLWYPHATDTLSFLRAVLNQCKATVLAMDAIRKVNQDASLVQTEDIGHIASTAVLQYQAEFENIRKWLTFDLLFGRVDHHHRMWQFMTWAGVQERELTFFLDNPCPPNIIGINHYVTSNRFLDHRVHLYDKNVWGGNGLHSYVDVEWIRVEGSPSFTLYEHLCEAWDRYQTPIVITESHLGCDCELERGAWIGECISSAIQARRVGIQISAVTLWALLGAFDWSSLITRSDNRYEAGLFDARGGIALPTSNVERIREITQSGKLLDPLLREFQGWWRRPERILYPAEELSESLKNIPLGKRGKTYPIVSLLK